MYYTIFTIPFVFNPLRVISKLVYSITGWTVVGEIPPTLKKCVVIAAPHTSNWDFPIMLMAAIMLKANVRWMGKHTLFRFPFGGFMKFLGGIPVNREYSDNRVRASAEMLTNSPGEFRLAIAPEGTRKKVARWKTGFYYIAQGAHVPVVLGFIDYSTKRCGIGKIVNLSGDADADMASIQAFYATFKGRR